MKIPARSLAGAVLVLAMGLARAWGQDRTTGLAGGATAQAAAAVDPGQEAIRALAAAEYARALQLSTPAAQQGDLPAQYVIARLYEEGWGVEKSSATAAAWYAYVLARSTPAAERGDAPAQYVLGLLYQSGHAVAHDDARALVWFSTAAQKGYVPAEETLGDAYASGRGASRDETKALEWYRKAAEQGSARAQNRLGEAYASGSGVAKDEAQAVAWFRKAADQGDPRAQRHLGMAYRDGLGVAKDDSAAVDWLRKSAAQGDAEAQGNLGAAYLYGSGVPRDEAAAFDLFRKAAEQGNAKAQRALGFMFAQGRGTKRNLQEGVDWIRKSAEQGDAEAQFDMAAITFHGEGVDSSLSDAAGWFAKAAKQRGSAWVLRVFLPELLLIGLLLAGYFLVARKPYVLPSRLRGFLGFVLAAAAVLVWFKFSRDPFLGSFIGALALFVGVPIFIVSRVKRRKRAGELKVLAMTLELAAVSDGGFAPDAELGALPVLNRSRIFFFNPMIFYNIFSGQLDGWEALLFDISLASRRVIWWLRSSTVILSGQSVAALKLPTELPGFVLAPADAASASFRRVDWPNVPLDGVLPNYQLRAEQPSAALRLLTPEAVAAVGAGDGLIVEAKGPWMVVYRNGLEVDAAKASEFWKSSRRLAGLLCANGRPPQKRLGDGA